MSLVISGFIVTSRKARSGMRRPICGDVKICKAAQSPAVAIVDSILAARRANPNADIGDGTRS